MLNNFVNDSRYGLRNPNNEVYLAYLAMPKGFAQAQISVFYGAVLLDCHLKIHYWGGLYVVPLAVVIIQCVSLIGELNRST